MTTLTTSSGINNVGVQGVLTTFDLHAHPFDIDEATATWNTLGGGALAGGTLGILFNSTSFDVELLGQSVTSIATLAADSTTYVDNALPGAGTFHYRIAATNTDNGSTTDPTAA